MNNVINELRSERDALRNRLARVDAAIDEYERWARSAADLIGTDILTSDNDTGANPVLEQTPISAFEDAVRALFNRASSPLKRADVYEELTRAGVVVGGKDPLNTVASRLSRMKGITNLRGLGYWATGRPYPDAEQQEDPASAGELFEEDSGRSAEGFKPDEVSDNDARFGV